MENFRESIFTYVLVSPSSATHCLQYIIFTLADLIEDVKHRNERDIAFAVLNRIINSVATVVVRICSTLYVHILI